ncbi:LysM domain-containing protein, partial [Bacteriovoracaceae bacterium]|nr:LysM domain-containing protein [Bacteriovoracaceae bacterium]
NWNNGTNAGAFTLNLNNAPSNTNIGFRCGFLASADLGENKCRKFTSTLVNHFSQIFETPRHFGFIPGPTTGDSSQWSPKLFAEFSILNFGVKCKCMFFIRMRNVFMALSIFCYDARGMSSYTVKNGDTFSEILEKYTAPPPSLYGKNGRIARILALNPNIKNPNFIMVGETVILEKFSKNRGHENRFDRPSKISKRVLDETRIKESQLKGERGQVHPILDKDDTGIFDLGIGLGGKYYSHSQSGALGSANVGVLFLNNFSLFTSYEKKNFKLEMEAYSYKFKYDVSGSSTERQLYGYSLKSYYKNLFFGVAFEQQPLFKNNGGDVELVAESGVLPSLGYKWNIILSTKIETRLLVQTSVSYLLDSSASDPDVKISEHKGFGADVKTRLTRRLNKSKCFPIYYYWSNDLGYRDYERFVEWGTSNGTVRSEHLHFNSTIGLKIEF